MMLSTNKTTCFKEVVDGQPFNEHSSHYGSYHKDRGNFDFSNRFDAEEVEWILNKPLDIIEGRTAVHVEVHRKLDCKSVDRLSQLLALGGCPNTRDNDGQTALHYAVTKNHEEIICLLLTHGADLHLKDSRGRTPLRILQSTNSSLYCRIVQEYLSANFDNDDLQVIQRLHEFVQLCGPLEEFKQLYSQISPKIARFTDLGNQTLLYRACKQGWLEGVSFLLSKATEIPLANVATEETPLHAACEGNHYDIVVELTTKYPDLLLMKDKLPYRGWYPIHTACAFGASDKILHHLLSGTLFLSKERSKDDMANVNFIDAFGRSPLYIATKCGNLSHINLMTDASIFIGLLEYASSLFAVTSDNISQVSAVHCAIVHNKVELLQALLNKFPLSVEVLAYPTVFSLSRMPPCKSSSMSVAPLLKTTLCQSNDGRLQLISVSKSFDEHKMLCNIAMSTVAMAAAMGNVEIVKMLLDAGTSDEDGLAARLALFTQHIEVAKMLLAEKNDPSICTADHKKLTTLPNTSYSFTKIYLQHNMLSSLPITLFQNPNLKVLDLSHNDLAELPLGSSLENSWLCKNLETLDLSHNKLTTLPSIIWKLSNLRYFYAQNNSIIELETSNEYCAKLEEIDLSYNVLCKLSHSTLVDAKVVNISHNKLESLPKTIWKLETIKSLNASNNLISKINFPKSSCLPVRDRLFSFTSTGKKAAKGEGNTRISSSSSSECQFELTGITKLNLSNNKLNSFPEELACFTCNLQNLDVSGNQIGVLHVCLLPPNLKSLSAKGCSLASIEVSDANKEFQCQHRCHNFLENLNYLDVKENTLSDFCFEYTNLSASRSRLIFPSLNHLDLSNNQFHMLNSNIGKQKGLTTLYLNDNVNLENLPLELSNISGTLNNITLNNLPKLKDPPREYHSSTKKLLSFMKSRLKCSVPYRTLNLVIVGGNKKGKTSLARRLSKNKIKSPAPLNEINLLDWKFSLSASTATTAVDFKIWDFPSQEQSHTFNYCFYSKQAIFLVVFSIANGKSGIEELDAYLRNIKAHAPGCPVIVVGTHLDVAGSVKKDEISQEIKKKYSNNGCYPEVSGVYCVSNTDSQRGTIKMLRQKIYFSATHLCRIGKQKLTVEGQKPLDDPDMLIQQQIPKSYIDLQCRLALKASHMKLNKMAPIMTRGQFNQCFLLEDEEELTSAADFLHCQRDMLHFNDPATDLFYFLDVKWVFSSMMNIARMPCSSDGITLNGDLIAQSAYDAVIPEHLQEGFLALLAKFDFAIPWDSGHMFVHCLLPKETELDLLMSFSTEPKVENDPNVIVPGTFKGLYNKARSLRSSQNKKRLAITNSIVDVIIKSDAIDSTTDDMDGNIDTTDSSDSTDLVVAIDNISLQITNPEVCERSESCFPRSAPRHLPVSKTNSFSKLNIVDSLSFEHSTDLSSPSQSLAYHQSWSKAATSSLLLQPHIHRVWLANFIPDGFWPRLFTKIVSDNEITSALSTLLNIALSDDDLSVSAPSLWNLCQTGCKVEYDTIELLELKQVNNVTGISCSTRNLSEQYGSQIELKIKVREFALVHRNNSSNDASEPAEVMKLYTRVLVFIEQHILDIGSEWFPGTICDSRNKEILSYVPCPNCLSENTCKLDDPNHLFVCCDGYQAFCFSLKELLTAYAQPSMSISCPAHNDIPVQHLAPDMCFKDLDKEVFCGPEIPLTIDKDKELGIGASALVLRGEIRNNDMRKLVAVKVLWEGSKHTNQLTDFLDNYTTSVESYREMRREVMFLSSLHHDHLTQLCGVRTNPFMLLMELAPLGCLSSILKQYRAANCVLTPPVLQESMCQIASALDFLHKRHVVYLDLKSDNVLVWKFPMARESKTDYDVLLKITDYGISRISSVACEIRSDAVAGTEGFIAPEVYKGKQQVLQSDKIDVFAFGMFLYELVALLKPFELQSDQPRDMINKMQRPKIPESAKESFTPCLIHKIMECCWDQDPKRRPSMAQVLEWSKLPQLCSLRTIQNMEPNVISCISQCLVVRDHKAEYAAIDNLPSIQHTFPNCQPFPSFFTSITPKSPPTNRSKDKVNHHTQAWVTQDNSDTTSKLTIFTFRSSDLGYRIHEDCIPQVVAMVSVTHYMWVCTIDHKLFIIHTATMRTVSCVVLENSSQQVLQLLHVPEWHTVLVLFESSEIWCLCDEVDKSGVNMTEKLLLHNNISELCKVNYQQTTEVWGTMRDKKIVVLTQTPTGCLKHETLKCLVPNEGRSLNCNLISSLSDTGGSQTHVWVSFEECSQLVCWSAENKTQLHLVSLHCKDENCQGQVTALLGHQNHLYIGTSMGTVEIFDSECGCFLQQFSWHESTVKSLIELPPEIKKSICAEHSPVKYKSVSRSESLADNDRIVPHKRVSQESFLKRNESFQGMSSTTKPAESTKCPLIASLGHNLADSLNCSNDKPTDNVTFLTWTGLSCS